MNDDMSETYSTHGRNKECVQKFSSENFWE